MVHLLPGRRIASERCGSTCKKPDGDREMVEILPLVLQHDENSVLVAVEMALAAGVPTRTHVLNLLHRLIDGKTANTHETSATSNSSTRTRG